MPMIEKDPVFDILVNERGEVLIAIFARKSTPSNPVILINNRHIVLMHTEDEGMDLGDLPEDVLEKIKQAHEVIVAETEKDKITREYTAIVHVEQS